MRGLLIGALLFVLLITPSLLYPNPSPPDIQHHPIRRSLEYIEPTISRINEEEGFLNFSSYHVHFYVIGSGERVLFLPGYGRTAKRTLEAFQANLENVPFQLIIIDPPGMGLSNGPRQDQYALTGNGSVKSVYFRRYTRFAYEAAKAFNVSIISGASLGGITTFLLANFVDVRYAIPVMSAGYREFSMHRGDAINRFIRDPEAKRVIDEFDPAVFAPYLKVPIYMIVGDEDEVFDVYAFLRTFQALRTEKHIVMLPNTAHGPYKSYFEALKGVYAAINGDNSRVTEETFYVGSLYSYTSRLPVSAFGLKITTFYNHSGPFESVIEEYFNAPLLLAYLAILAITLRFLRHVGERRLYVYSGLFSFIPRVRSPKRFAIITIPPLPRFFFLSALLLLLTLRKRRLTFTAFFPRIVISSIYSARVFPVYLALFRALAIYEEAVKRKWGSGGSTRFFRSLGSSSLKSAPGLPLRECIIR